MRTLAETLGGVKRTLDTTRTVATRRPGLVDHGPRVRAILNSRVRRGPASGHQVATQPNVSDPLTYHDHDLLANQDHKMSGQDVDQWGKLIMKKVDLDEMWIMKDRRRYVDHQGWRSTREQDPQEHDPHPHPRVSCIYYGRGPRRACLDFAYRRGGKNFKNFLYMHVCDDHECMDCAASP